MDQLRSVGGSHEDARRRPVGTMPRPPFGLIFLLGWSLVTALPFVWMMLTSLKENASVFGDPWGLPLPPHPENYVRAWETAAIGRYFINSAFVVSGSLILTLTIASMASYVFARFEFPLRRTLFFTFIIGTTFPLFLAIVPLFFLLRDVGLLDTHLGLIVVYSSYWLPFNVFFLTSFFRTLPSELGEAALIDGAGEFRVFWSVMLPLARPGIVTLAIFTFIGQWNEFLLPLVLIFHQSDFLVPQGLAALSARQGQYADWSALFAGLMIATVPSLVIYTLFSSRIQRGLTAGSLKG